MPTSIATDHAAISSDNRMLSRVAGRASAMAPEASRRAHPQGLSSGRRAQQAGPMNILYTAEATATGGREGHVASSDGALRLDLAVPKELGGPGGVATNPEQLFAAGYAACFDNAMIRVARRMKLSTGGGPRSGPGGNGAAPGGGGPP